MKIPYELLQLGVPEELKSLKGFVTDDQAMSVLSTYHAQGGRQNHESGMRSVAHLVLHLGQADPDSRAGREMIHWSSLYFLGHPTVVR